MMKLVLLTIVLPFGGMQAQSLSFGIKGGAQLTPAIESSAATSESSKYLIGPTAEVKLPFSFAFEADLLYRHVSFQSVMTSDSVNALEIPLLAKYYFGPSLSPVKFYAAGGYVFRQVVRPTAAVESHTLNGVVLGGGTRLRFGPFSLSPEVRFIHWSGKTFDQQSGHGYYFTSKDNQADLLVGFTF